MPSRASEQVINLIEEGLRDGSLKAGSRIPGERTLCMECGVGRSSVREGLRVLEAFGIIRSSAGTGPDAGSFIASEPQEGFSRAMAMHLLVRSFGVADTIEFRELVEGWAAAQAARCEDSPQRTATLEEAGLLLERMDDPRINEETFHDLDMQFHTLISALGGNAVVDTTLGALRSSVLGYVLAAVKELPDRRAEVEILQSEHRQLLQAVQEHNSEEAQRIAVEHIRGFAKRAKISLQQ